MAETALATAYVKIVPSFKGFQEEWRKQMPDTGAAGAEQGKRFSTGFSKSVGGSLKSQLASVFATGAVVSFTKDLISAGEAEVASNKKLENVAKSMGIFGDQSQVVAKRLENLSSVQQMQLGIDDDTIKSTQLKLLTFANLAKSAGVAGGMFDRATIAAQDLAAAGFGDATSNAVQLGKALQDPEKGITALARSGVTFTEQEKAKIKTLMASGKVLEAQNMIMKAVETQVGGTAAAGVTGSMKMKQAFAQFTESLGVALLPTFNKVADFVVKVLIPKLQDFFTRFQQGKTFLNPVINLLVGFVHFFVHWKDFLLPIIGGITALVVAMKVWRAITTVVTAAQIALDVALNANPIGAIIMAVIALGTALWLFFTKTKTGRVIFAAMVEAFKVGFNFLKNLAIDFANFFIDALNLVILSIDILIKAMNLIPGINIPEIKTVNEIKHTGNTPKKPASTTTTTTGTPAATNQVKPGGISQNTTLIYNAAPNNSIDSHQDLKKAVDKTRQRSYR